MESRLKEGSLEEGALKEGVLEELPVDAYPEAETRIGSMARRAAPIIRGLTRSTNRNIRPIKAIEVLSTGEVLCQVEGLAMTPLLQGSVTVRDIPACLLGLGMTEQNQLHGLR